MKYKPVPSGLRELAQSPGMAAAMLEVGQRMAGNANAVGDSTYEAKSVIVRAGWQNQPRHGASVAEVERDWRDSRDRVLLRVGEAMAVRGRR